LPSFVERQPQPARRVAVTVAAIFAASGTAWVLLTDLLLYGTEHNRELIAHLETAKGWVFVGLGCWLVYAVTLRSATRVVRAHIVVSAVVESIADGLLLLGPDRTIVYANPAAGRMLNCARPEDLIGMDAAEFSRRFRVSYPNGALVAPDDLISQRVYHEGGPLHYKGLLFPPGEEELVISATAAAIRERAREHPAMVVSVLHDITVPEHLERLRDQFFAAAAHSLKTPVAVIKAQVQVLSRVAPPQYRHSAAAIERQCDRIDRLVQNLFVLSRARSHTLKLHASELDLAALVDRVTRDMRALLHQHELRLEIAARPRVRGDEERLGMMVANVIDEASRASIPGSPMRVLLTRSGADAEIGIGHYLLPPEERPRETYGEYGDTGIGRCVAAEIAGAHGGKLREDTIGDETIAWIHLPMSEESHERA
jgi:signal transduction histidine kinase